MRRDEELSPLHTYAVVLAAGKGTRMRSDLAKVLHRANGRPLIQWMLDLLAPIEIDRIVVVIGHQAEAVRDVLGPEYETALQRDQLGTGHADMVGMEGIELFEGDRVLVSPGDMPLIRTESLQRLFSLHEERRAAATILTVTLDDPPPYGRIIRDDSGDVVQIVEARDATPEQLAIHEVNTSVYVFDGAQLTTALDELRPDNDQGEFYLTDVIGILAGRGLRVAALAAAGPEEGQGVNTIAELEEVGARLATRRDPI